MLISLTFVPSIRTFIAAFTLLMFGSICLAQGDVTKPVTGVEDVYLAKDDGGGRAGDVVTSFKLTDVPIHCIVQLDSPTTATVRMNFVAVSVPGVKPESRVVSTIYTTKNGEDRVNFTGKPRGNWTAGKYRVDIFVDGKLSKNLEFEIRSAASVVTGTSFVPPSTPPKPKPPRTPKKN